MDENRLREAGVDYDAALARFVGSRDIYERYLSKLLADTHTAEAEKAFAAGDYEEVLEQTHALKGLAGTLGLKGLYESSADIVKDLRDGKYETLYEKLAQMKEEWERICEVIRNA